MSDSIGDLDVMDMDIVEVVRLWVREAGWHVGGGRVGPYQPRTGDNATRRAEMAQQACNQSCSCTVGSDSLLRRGLLIRLEKVLRLSVPFFCDSTIYKRMISG